MSDTSKSNLTKGILYGGLAGIIWGTLSIFISLLKNFGMSDIAVSSLGPMIIIIFYGIKTLVKNPKAFKICWKPLLIVLVGGGIVNALTYYSYAMCLNYMGAGVFSALDFSHVFILMLLSSFIFKYKITKGKILSLSLAVVGMVMVLNVFSPEAFISPMGLLWIAVDWFCNCAIALLLKWALNNEIDNDVLITYYNLGAALIYWTVCPPWAVVGEIAAAQNIALLVATIAAYGIFTQILTQYVWVKSFSLVDPAITNMMAAFSPITAAVLGYFMFGQVISWIQILGIAVVIAAVVILNKTGAAEEL